MGFNFEQPDIALFDETAEKEAKALAAEGNGSKVNATTQLRRFYDEVCMWQSKIGSSNERFAELAPFIKMINAKVAYANARKPKLVSDSFCILMRDCIKEIKSPNSLKNFKLFFEAIIGFKKFHSKEFE